MVRAGVAQQEETIAWLETERGHKIPVQGVCNIGREAGNDIILRTSAVSRRHAMIHEKDHEFWMVDLGSFNGILVNGNRVFQSVRLQTGDRILLPTASFTFRQETRPVVVPAPPEAKKAPAPIAPPLISERLEEKKASSPIVPARRAPQSTRLAGKNDPLPATPVQSPPVPSVAREKKESSLIAPARRTPASKPSEEKKELPPATPVQSASAPVPSGEKMETPPAAPLPSVSSEEKKAPAIKSPQPPLRSALVRKASEPSPETPAALAPVASEEHQELLPLTTLPSEPVPVPSEEKKVPVVKPPQPPLLSTLSWRAGESLSETPDQLALATSHPEEPQESLRLTPVSPAPVSPPPAKKPVPPAIPPVPYRSASAPSEEIKEPSATASDLTATSPEPEEEAAQPTTTPVQPFPASPNKRKKQRPAQPPELLPSGYLSPQNVSREAKRSMYIGLASIFLPFISLVFAVVAIVLGHKALRSIKQANGSLAGRDYAIKGLYFGYITLAIFLAYAVLFYAIYSSFHSRPVVVANTPTAPALTPLVVNPVSQETPGTPASVAAVPDQPPAPSAPPAVATPSSPTSETPPSIAVVSDNPPPPSVPPSVATTSGPISQPSGPEVVLSRPTETPDASLPPTVPKSQSSPTQTSALPALTSDGFKAQPVVPFRGNPLAVTLRESDDPTEKIPAVSDQPPVQLSPAPTPRPVLASKEPPVFSYDQQAKLKDEMLALPMPSDDTDSPAYLDAEAFNNSARILARKPESQYVDSVQQFLDDVKGRNPNQIRLVILSAMYENYKAALGNP